MFCPCDLNKFRLGNEKISHYTKDNYLCEKVIYLTKFNALVFFQAGVIRKLFDI